MANQVTSGVLLDLIESVADPGQIHPAFAGHVTAMLRSYLADESP